MKMPVIAPHGGAQAQTRVYATIGHLRNALGMGTVDSGSADTLCWKHDDDVGSSVY
jgi:hypothetical protein